MGNTLFYTPRKASNCLVVVFLLCFLSIISVALLPDSDYAFAITFCVYYVATLLLVWRGAGSKVTPFFLFLLTIGLFNGGSFIGKLMGGIDGMFHIDFFINYTCSYYEKKELTIFLISFISALSFGYLRNYAKFYFINISPKSTNDYTRLESFISGAFWVLAPVLILDVLSVFLSVFQNGYVFLYQNNQTEGYSFGFIRFLGSLYHIFFGLAYGFCNKKIRIRYLSVYIVHSLIVMAMGARGALGSMMLFLFWMYSLNRNISLKKLVAYCLVAAAVLILGLSLSVRGHENDITNGGSIWNELSSFISGQGISLMVFEISRSVDHYPTLAYVQTLIPGSSYIYSLFTGQPVFPYDNNMSQYMCYTLNRDLFEAGFGTGWSLMSDLYLFGGRKYIVFVLLSFLFGFGISKIELTAATNRWIKSLLFTIVMPLLMLPRSSLNSFSTLIIYTLLVYILLKILIGSNNQPIQS